MKSVVPKKAAALLLVCAAGLAFFIFETVQTVRANAEAQLMEEWGLETAADFIGCGGRAAKSNLPDI